MPHSRKNGEICQGRFFQNPVTMLVKCNVCNDAYSPPPRKAPAKSMVASVDSLNKILRKKAGVESPEKPTPDSFEANIGMVGQQMAKNAALKQARAEAEAARKAEQADNQQPANSSPTPAVSTPANEMELIQEVAALRKRLAELEAEKPAAPAPKKRGRPKKVAEPVAVDKQTEASETATQPASEPKAVRPVGKPTPDADISPLVTVLRTMQAEGERSKQEAAAVGG